MFQDYVHSLAVNMHFNPIRNVHMQRNDNTLTRKLHQTMLSVIKACKERSPHSQMSG